MAAERRALPARDSVKNSSENNLQCGAESCWKKYVVRAELVLGAPAWGEMELIGQMGGGEKVGLF
jgi:hypothetical protein